MTRHTALKPQLMSSPYPEASHHDTAEAIQAGNPDWLVM